MLPYHPGRNPPARVLRRTLTDAERLLWSRVRGQQIGPVPFYRQKPLGGYIVDFHATNSFTGHLNFPVSCRRSVRHPQLGRSAQNGAIRQKKGVFAGMARSYCRSGPCPRKQSFLPHVTVLRRSSQPRMPHRRSA